MGNRIGIIGAGAAGLLAAGRAAELGKEVVVFDKNHRPGRKLLITGKGRCNITNACDTDELMANIPGNGRFLYSALSRFGPYEIMGLFEENGVNVKTERGNRVFPVSDKAADVVDALFRYAKNKGASFRFNTRVEKLDVAEGQVRGVHLSEGGYEELDSIIVATGGLSYPLTGSTGDGYRFARDSGHEVTGLNPSLVPLETKEDWVKSLQGLSLKNVSLSVYDTAEQKVYEELGEMLFTHFGVSGPLILSASRHILDFGYRDARLSIDLKPGLDEEMLDKRLQRDFAKYSRKQFANALDELLPKSLIPVFVTLSGLEGEKPVHQITKGERLGLVKLLKALPLTVSRARPVDEAIVTAGGVSVKGINPSTMESRQVKGLFFAGEVLDVDGYTGGFNLTIAFSTGYTAGSRA